MTHSTSSPDHEDESAEEQPAPRQSVTARTFHSLVDQRIAAAEAAGAFRDLPGAGKPLKLDDDATVPAEERAAFRLLKNAGFAPPWIELQKEIRTEQEALNHWLMQQQQHWSTLDEATQERLRADYRRRLVALNRQISSYNLMAPRSARHLPTFRVERELARLGET
jgi:hypothetical protein